MSSGHVQVKKIIKESGIQFVWYILYFYYCFLCVYREIRISLECQRCVGSASLSMAGKDARFRMFAFPGRLPLAMHILKEDIHTSTTDNGKGNWEVIEPI